MLPAVLRSPIIDTGLNELASLAHNTGLAGLPIHDSYNREVLGHHNERLINHGIIGPSCNKAPAFFAPSGGKIPIIGTNPLAFAAPDIVNECAFVIDQSASVVIKSEIIMRAGSDKPIPIDWGFDAEGEPTTNANISLKDSMRSSGGYKGFGVELLVETFSAAPTGAMLSEDVNAFSGAEGGSPKTGQFFIVITRAISLVMCLPPNEITK